jgi:hypothetical protein
MVMWGVNNDMLRHYPSSLAASSNLSWDNLDTIDMNEMFQQLSW